MRRHWFRYEASGVFIWIEKEQREKRGTLLLKLILR